MKSIYTLIPDIQDYISKNEDWYINVCNDVFRRREGIHQDRNRRNSLRLSGLGNRCPKALWYSIHHPEVAEELPPDAKFKLGYGHLIEDMALSLAKLAGHTVEGEQDEISVDGVLGHRDAVVDGCILDVKSGTSYTLEKARARKIEEDVFLHANLLQLDGYILGSRVDDLVHVKDRGYILYIDKTLGHMVLYEHELREEKVRRRIREYDEICRLHDAPRCNCGIRREKSTGLIALDVKASYSQYKHVCFPNLRTEVIGGKPVYFPE
jgi:hypothetical protein